MGDRGDIHRTAASAAKRTRAEEADSARHDDDDSKPCRNHGSTGDARLGNTNGTRCMWRIDDGIHLC